MQVIIHDATENEGIRNIQVVNAMRDSCMTFGLHPGPNTRAKGSRKRGVSNEDRKSAVITNLYQCLYSFLEHVWLRLEPARELAGRLVDKIVMRHPFAVFHDTNNASLRTICHEDG